MAMNTLDSHMLSTHRGAPAGLPVAGNTITILDAFLLTGYGPVTAASASIADGICTAVVNAGESFDKHSVILVSGITPASLNGRKRVTSSTSTSVSWLTDEPDGLVTGTIGLRYAPAPSGWEKQYTGEHKAVYRSTHPASSGACLWIDDSNSHYALVRGFRSMSNLDAGDAPFPPASRLTEAMWCKSYSSSSAPAKPYFLWGDRSALIVARDISATGALWLPLGFGDPFVINPVGDPDAAFLACQHSVTSVVGLLNAQVTAASGSNGGVFACRSAAGTTPASLYVRALVGGTSHSGIDTTWSAASGALDGKLLLSEFAMVDGVGVGAPRSILPALRHVPQSGVTGFEPGQVIELGGGRVVVALPFATQVTAARSGTYFVELGVGRA